MAFRRSGVRSPSAPQFDHKRRVRPQGGPFSFYNVTVDSVPASSRSEIHAKPNWTTSGPNRSMHEFNECRLFKRLLKHILNPRFREGKPGIVAQKT
jgi:hypothetical protein